MRKLFFISFLLFFAVNTNLLQAQFAGGSGTFGDPYQIADVDQLQEMNNFLSSNFILINDIDASATSGWNGGAGFEPVGDLGAFFTGFLNGNGFIITGLTINRPSQDNIGLFGISAGEIREVAMVNVNITGQDYTGGLVGLNTAFINTCYATGTVSGNELIGGLAGSHEGTIDNSYATITVSGSGFAGGLAGTSIGTITNSYATGTISGSQYIGGLVGTNDGTITNSYATGSVSGNSIGGLVAINVDPGTITNSYATGSVSGSFSVGGLVGINADGTITNSYWNITTSGQAASSGGTGLTDSQFRQEASFTGFNFTNDWDIVETPPITSYPFLQSNPQDPPPGYAVYLTTSGDIPGGTYQNVTIDGAGITGTLTGDVTVLEEMTLTEGNLAIGANILTLSGPVDFTGGTFNGSDASDLIINGSGSITGELTVSGSNYLGTLSTSREITIGNNLRIAGELMLDNANLNLGNRRLRLEGDLSMIGSGTMSGTIESELFIEGTAGNISLPEMTLKELRIYRDADVTLSGSMTINKILRLFDGTFIAGDFLTMTESTVFINNGSLTGNPVFNNKLRIYYSGENPNVTGSECLNQNIQFMELRAGADITLGSDITVHQLNIKEGNLNISDKNVILPQAGSYIKENGGVVTGTTGKISITSGMPSNIIKNPGELGAVFTTRKKMGSTMIERGFEAQTIDDGPGINRYYNITPTSTNLNLDFEFNYHESELNNSIEGSLLLYIYDGITWELLGDGGVVDTENNTITVTNLTAIEGRVTAKGTQLGAPIVEGNDRTKDNDKKKGNDRTKGDDKTSDSRNQLKTKGDMESREDENISETEIMPEIPSETGLIQNYPNPFNPTTTIKFALPENDFVSVKVFDISGREIAELVNGNLNAGYHSVQFDGTNLSSGIYFYKITTGSGFEKVMRMSLVK